MDQLQQSQQLPATFSSLTLQNPPSIGESSVSSKSSSLYKTSYPKTLLIQNPSKGLLFGQYRLLQTLGEGEFGKVKLALLPSLQPVAIKFVKKSMLSSKSKLGKLLREIKLLEQCKHRHIVRLIEVLESEKYIGLVMEYAEGGELFDYILRKQHLRENEARRLFVQLLSGVQYLHRIGIVHRDFKLENLLLDQDRNIKITDMGFANNNYSDTLLTTSCGSPCYAAPELVLEKSYKGEPADVWSCGVILYAMLCGYLPFDDDASNPDSADVNQLYKYIIRSCEGDGATPPLGLNFPDHVSADARSLCHQILCIDPDRRFTVAQILQHKWMLPVAKYVSNPKLEVLDNSALNSAAVSLDTISTKDVRDRVVSEPISAAETQASLKKRGKFLTIDTKSTFHWFLKSKTSPIGSSSSDEQRQDQTRKDSYSYKKEPLFSAPLSSSTMSTSTKEKSRIGFRSLFKKSPLSHLKNTHDTSLPHSAKFKMASVAEASDYEDKDSSSAGFDSSSSWTSPQSLDQAVTSPQYSIQSIAELPSPPNEKENLHQQPLNKLSFLRNKLQSLFLHKESAEARH